jgi:hypothetical protein
MAVYFTDESGINALPPGILVALADSAGDVVGSDYLRRGGRLNVDVQGAVPYVASFSGTLAPRTSVAFLGNAVGGADTIVAVPGYCSPTLSGAGYTKQQTDNLWVRGWFSQVARTTGGNAYALASALAATHAKVDDQAMRLLSAMRGQTCEGPDLDSWAADFFGKRLPRYTDEPDELYRSRVFAAFGPRCTLAAIEQLVVQFYAATLRERMAAGQTNLSYDTGQGGFDSRGGFGTYVAPLLAQTLTPVVKIWDSQSQPALATLYGVTVPQFVVQIGFTGAAQQWFLDNAHLDIETFLTDGSDVQTSFTPPDPRLGALVNLVKAAGTQPLYQTYIGS